MAQTSPYAARPSSLETPVPQQQRASLEDMLANAPDETPAINAPAPAQAAPAEAAPQAGGQSSLEQMLANAPDEGQQPIQGRPVASVPPEGADIQSDVGWADLKNKVISGLAANKTEQRGFLEHNYGADNVREDSKGELSWKKPGEEKWHKLSPDAFGTIGNFVLDQARNTIFAGSTVAGGVAGAGVGAAVGGLAGIPVGLRAGQIGGAAAATTIADKIAEAAGVPQDPARYPKVEALVAGATEGVAPAVIGKAKQYIPGTSEYVAAKAAKQAETVALSAQSQAVADSFKRIGSDLVAIPGTNVKILAHQINPDSPDLAGLVNQAKQTVKFLNATKDQAEGWADAANRNLMEIARQGSAGPVAPERLSSVVTNAVENLERTEGQAIGGFKAKAQIKLGDQKFPMQPEAQQQLKQMSEAFGFSIRAGKNGELSLIPPDAEKLQQLRGMKGLTKMGDIKAFVNAIQTVGEAELKGGMSLSDANRFVNVVGDLNRNASQTAFSGEWGQLSATVRQQRRSIIEQGLDSDVERKAFNNTMDDFSRIRTNVDTLKNVLNDDASAKAIVGNIFTGKESIPRIQAIKSLTADSPEVWSALKEEWMNQQLTKFADRNSPFAINPGKFLDALDKQYGDQFMRTVFNEAGDRQKIRDFLTVGERLARTFQGTNIDTMTEKQRQGAANAAIGAVAGIKFKLVGGLVQYMKGILQNKDAPFIALLDQGEIEKYVANYPGKIDKEETTRKLYNIVANWKVMRAAGGAAKPATGYAKGYVRSHATVGGASKE